MKFKDYSIISEKYGISSNWMNLQEGDNKIRIVSEFEDYGVHFDRKKKKSIICIGKENCQFCKQGDSPKVQFLGWVIDRKDSKIKLLRVGYQIFQQIGNLANSEEYGFEDIPDYDITIKRTGKGLETEYTVIPARQNTELTLKEKEEIEKLKSIREIIDAMKSNIEQINESDIPVVDDDIPF